MKEQILFMVFALFFLLIPLYPWMRDCFRKPVPYEAKAATGNSLFYCEMLEVENGKSVEQVISERKVPGFSNQTPLPESKQDWDEQLKTLANKGKVK